MSVIDSFFTPPTKATLAQQQGMQRCSETLNLQKPILDASVAGPPYELGRQLGIAQRGKIRATFSILHRLPFFRAQQPWWMPYPLFYYLAQRQAREKLIEPIKRDYPRLSQRIVGMAEGAGVNPELLYLFHAFEAIPPSLNYRCPPNPECGQAVATAAACTCLAIRGKRSKDGEPVLAHNFDSLPILRAAFVVREVREQGKYRFLTFTGAPFSGAVDGMNEYGLCITYNYAHATDNHALTAPRPPISMAIDEALGTCRTVAEAVRKIASLPRSGGALLMLADARGDMAALEISSTRSTVRRPLHDLLFHSNRYQSPSLRELEVPSHAVYGDDSPASLRGRTILESPRRRDERLAQLVLHDGPLDLGELTSIMADHGYANRPSENTICMHGPYWSTTACLQWFPRTRRLHVSYGRACEAKFETFHVS